MRSSPTARRSSAWTRRSAIATSTRCRWRSAPICRARACSKGARVALMMPNVLQYPVATAAVLRAGYAVVNVNPLYTPRELEHQLKDSGAEAIIVLENFATHRAAGDREDRGQARHRRQHGRPARLQGRDRQSRRAPREEDGAGLFAAGRGRLQRRDRGRPRHELQQAEARRPTTSPSCNIPAAPPASPRARRCSTATSSPTCCRTMPGCSRRWQKPPHVDQLFIVCALPLYHIFALTACYLLAVRAGGVQSADPQPARHGRLRQGAGRSTRSTASRPSTRSTTACCTTPDFEQARLLQAEDLERRRHGVQTAGGRAVAEDRPAAPSSEGYGLSETSPTLTCNPRRPSTEFYRLDRHSRALDLYLDPRRRRQRSAARRARRDLRQGPAGDGGLLEQAGRDREGDDRGRLFPHRRHRRDGRRTATPRSSTARRT